MANDKKDEGKAGKKAGKGLKSARNHPQRCPRCRLHIGRTDSLNLHLAETCKREEPAKRRMKAATAMMKDVSGDNPRCPVCNHGTKHKSSVKKHLLRKHLPLGGKWDKVKGKGDGAEDEEEGEQSDVEMDEDSDESTLFVPPGPKGPGYRKEDDDGGPGGTGAAQPIEAC